MEWSKNDRLFLKTLRIDTQDGERQYQVCSCRGFGCHYCQMRGRVEMFTERIAEGKAKKE